MTVQPSSEQPGVAPRYLHRITAFDWLVIAGGLVNLAVISVIFGYAIFL